MIALDTNILVYAETIDDERKGAEAHLFLDRLDRRLIVVPAQVAGELFKVLTRKARVAPTVAGAIVASWTINTTVAPTTEATILAAMDLSASHNLQIWDAIILQAASEAGARILLSEDMHNGFTWNGTTIVNPFAPGDYAALLAPYMTGDA
jgi:predicted nucleic acid-binding protein